MTSDLYSYSYGNNDNMVELIFCQRSGLKDTKYMTEDEILEIAEKIKNKYHLCGKCKNNKDCHRYGKYNSNLVDCGGYESRGIK